MNRRTFWKQVAAYCLSCLAFVPLVRNLRIVRERKIFYVNVDRCRFFATPTDQQVQSIQEAMNRAESGDIVLLSPGQLRVPVRIGSVNKSKPMA